MRLDIVGSMGVRGRASGMKNRRAKGRSGMKRELEEELGTLRNEVNQLKEANRESLNTSEELESTLRSQIASLEKSLSESGDQSSVRLGELEVSVLTVRSVLSDLT
jgi:septal ring factor EnvC (AmiA/AmiB activator)